MTAPPAVRRVEDLLDLGGEKELCDFLRGAAGGRPVDLCMSGFPCKDTSAMHRLGLGLAGPKVRASKSCPATVLTENSDVTVSPASTHDAARLMPTIPVFPEQGFLLRRGRHLRRGQAAGRGGLGEKGDSFTVRLSLVHPLFHTKFD
jgi:hypothetical protein